MTADRELVDDISEEEFVGFLTLCVRRARKVDNTELPCPMADEKTRQKNINLFPRAYLGNHASQVLIQHLRR